MFNNEDLAVIDAIISRYPRKRSAIMPLLHFVQSKAGYVTNEGIELISQKLEIETAEEVGLSSLRIVGHRGRVAGAGHLKHGTAVGELGLARIELPDVPRAAPRIERTHRHGQAGRAANPLDAG
ncbi:MAG: hypothetical protein RL622_636, partial [Actinomycetota bacterium]